MSILSHAADSRKRLLFHNWIQENAAGIAHRSSAIFMTPYTVVGDMFEVPPSAAEQAQPRLKKHQQRALHDNMAEDFACFPWQSEG